MDTQREDTVGDTAAIEPTGSIPERQADPGQDPDPPGVTSGQGGGGNNAKTDASTSAVSAPAAQSTAANAAGKGKAAAGNAKKPSGTARKKLPQLPEGQRLTAAKANASASAAAGTAVKKATGGKRTKAAEKSTKPAGRKLQKVPEKPSAGASASAATAASASDAIATGVPAVASAPAQEGTTSTLGTRGAAGQTKIAAANPAPTGRKLPSLPDRPSVTAADAPAAKKKVAAGKPKKAAGKPTAAAAKPSRPSPEATSGTSVATAKKKNPVVAAKAGAAATPAAATASGDTPDATSAAAEKKNATAVKSKKPAAAAAAAKLVRPSPAATSTTTAGAKKRNPAAAGKPQKAAGKTKTLAVKPSPARPLATDSLSAGTTSNKKKNPTNPGMGSEAVPKLSSVGVPEDMTDDSQGPDQSDIAPVLASSPGRISSKAEMDGTVQQATSPQSYGGSVVDTIAEEPEGTESPEAADAATTMTDQTDDISVPYRLRTNAARGRRTKQRTRMGQWAQRSTGEQRGFSTTSRRPTSAIEPEGLPLEFRTTLDDEIRSMNERGVKSVSERQLMIQAVLENVHFRHWTEHQITAVICHMQQKTFEPGEVIIEQGDPGDRFYIGTLGQMGITKDGQTFPSLHAGSLFGELAIMFNCTRRATVTAKDQVRTWWIKKASFEEAMKQAARQRYKSEGLLLKKLPCFSDSTEWVLDTIVDLMETEHYNEGETISEEASPRKALFLNLVGHVRATKQRLPPFVGEDECWERWQGDGFGSLADGVQEVDRVTVKAESDVTVMVVRDELFRMMGNMKGHASKNPLDWLTAEREVPTLATISISDFIPDSGAPLSAGAFGRVELVTHFNDTYALKRVAKKLIGAWDLQDSVLMERWVLWQAQSHFLPHLYCSYRDIRWLYLLMEPCLGGTVSSLLDKGVLKGGAARFAVACVVEALDYIHRARVVHRDVQPANLLIGNDGYVKLAHFAVAKHLPGDEERTWSLCGTWAYGAPEMLASGGHDLAVDYWALGVLLYKVLTGEVLFSGNTPAEVIASIRQGLAARDYPVAASAIDLIRRLCRFNPRARLGNLSGGLTDVRMHDWFKHFEWARLRDKQLPSVLRPLLRGPLDKTHFLSAMASSQRMEAQPDEASDWDWQFDLEDELGNLGMRSKWKVEARALELAAGQPAV